MNREVNVTRLGLSAVLVLALVSVAIADDECVLGDCSLSPQEAFTRKGNHARAVQALREAFNIADRGNNNMFNGVKQRLDSEDERNSLHKIREDADDVVDDVDDRASATQVAGIKAGFDAAIAVFREGTTYFNGKKEALAALDLTGVAETNTSKINAMKSKLDAFLELWNTGVAKMEEAKSGVTQEKNRDQCRAQVDILENLINDLKDKRDALNDTIDPVEEARERAIESQTCFLSKCGFTAVEHEIAQLEAENAALRQNQDTLVAALNQAGVPVPTLIPSQAGLDDVDGSGAPGSPPAGSPPAGSPPAGSPPPGEDTVRGTALTAEQARGGLGAIAFANCAPMGYDCSPAAIYGPGGMVEVLARNITNRAVNDPNVIHTGDVIDFEAVDAFNN